MSDVELPEGYSVYKVEFVKRTHVYVAAKDRSDLERHVDAYEAERAGLLDDDDDWEYEGARVKNAAPSAIVADGKFHLIGDWTDSLARDGQIVDAPAGTPEWMRSACSRHRYSAGRSLFLVNVGGAMWIADGCSAISSKEPATSECPDGRGRSLEERLAEMRAPVSPGRRGPYSRTLGGHVVAFGPRCIASGYVDLIADLYPSATWEQLAQSPHPVVAVVDGAPVAIVMPLHESVSIAT
jgi:hypothetical protein